MLLHSWTYVFNKVIIKYIIDRYIDSNRSLRHIFVRHISQRDILQVQHICIERPLNKELIYALEEANVLRFQEKDSVSSVAQSCLTLCDPMNCSIPGLPVHHQLLEFTQTRIHWVSDAIQPSHPLSSPCPLAPNPSQHQSFSSKSTLHMRWPKYWSFSFSIFPSKGHPGLISFRMDWLDLLAVQGTLKSLLQHHSSKVSILRRSASFTVQLSHPYMTTGKTIALTRQTFFGNIMSLLLLSRLVITFLPRSKRLLISWLQSSSSVILEPPKNKVWHCFHCFSIYFAWSDGTRCHDLSFLNVEL